MTNKINSEPAADYRSGFEPTAKSSLVSNEDQAILDQAAGILEGLARKGDALTSPDLVRTWIKTELRSEPSEVFSALFLDNRHRIISFDKLFFGTIDGATVHPREVVRRALHHNAAAVILAHNHPSGVAEPSRADQTITKRLSDALALIDVRVLDHIVVGDGAAVSLIERGLM